MIAWANMKTVYCWLAKLKLNVGGRPMTGRPGATRAPLALAAVLTAGGDAGGVTEAARDGLVPFR